MTLEQFELLALLLRSRGPTKEAARMVLLSGASGADAARQTGLKPQSVSNTVQRFRHADSAVREAYSPKT